MEKIQRIGIDRYHQHKNFIWYSIIGASGVTIDILLFIILFNLVGLDEQVANVISISAGITNNFLWNAFLNFKKTDRLWKRFVSFYVVGIFGLGVSALILYIFHDLANINANIVKIISVPIIVAIQYPLNKYISFRTHSDE